MRPTAALLVLHISPLSIFIWHLNADTISHSFQKSIVMQRVATQLLALSPELVEPIIADLPLHKALELLSGPSESSPLQESLLVTGQLSPLAYSFIRSPAWRHVFTSEERTERLLLIWEASKNFFRLQTGRSYMQLLKSHEYGWRRSELLRAGADQLQGPEVLDQMSKGLFNLVPGLDVKHKEGERIAPSNAYMKAVFALLRDPKEVYQSGMSPLSRCTIHFSYTNFGSSQTTRRTSTSMHLLTKHITPAAGNGIRKTSWQWSSHCVKLGICSKASGPQNWSLSPIYMTNFRRCSRLLLRPNWRTLH